MERFIEAQVNLLTFCAQKFAQDTMKPLLFLLLYTYGITAVYGKYDYAGLLHANYYLVPIVLHIMLFIPVGGNAYASRPRKF